MSRYRVGRPCDVSWDELESRPGGRYCARCDTLVRDLTDATEDEARAWAGFACARIRRADARGLAILRRTSQAALSVALAAGLAGCDASVPGERREAQPETSAADEHREPQPETSAADAHREPQSEPTKPVEHLPVGVFLPAVENDDQPRSVPSPEERGLINPFE